MEAMGRVDYAQEKKKMTQQRGNNRHFSFFKNVFIYRVILHVDGYLA